MDDQKEKRGGTPEPDVEPNAEPNAEPSAEPQAGSDGEQSLHDELEDLARVFQEELDRAKAQAREDANRTDDAPGILIQSLDDLPDVQREADAEAAPKDDTEETLCECCGERPSGTQKDPDSPYCSVCDEGLRHYPFDFLNVLLALVLLVFVFYGGYQFADHTEVFVRTAQADSLAADNELYSALDAYTQAEEAMSSDRINGELVYKRAALTMYKLGYMSNVVELGDAVHSWELQLPHFRAMKTALDRAEQFLATGDAATEILSPYMSMSAQEIPYDDVLAQLEALKTADPKETTAAAEDTTDEAETMTEAADTDAYTPQYTGYNTAMVTFYQYYLALISDQPLETQIGFVEEMQSLEPEETWLYATLLGELYAKTGRDIEPICEKMLEVNAEDDTPALLRVIALRTAGDYDAAISQSEAQIEAGNEYAAELYRQIGLCYLLQGDYETAYEKVNEGFQTTNPSIQLVNTLALCASAAGEEDAYAEAADLLTSSGYTVSEEVLEYRAGTRTIESIFTEGDLDVT